MRNIKVVNTEIEVSSELSKSIKKISDDAIKKYDSFRIGLSGGSLVNFLRKSLPSVQTDWSKWRLFFCDERLVPLNSSDSTFGAYQDLISHTPLEESQFIGIDPLLNVRDAAVDYERKVRANFPDAEWPRFDLLLLGVGPDGHTASLFPNHKLLSESKLWIAPIDDSPKPPPCRVTMTFPVLNNARHCIFALAGKGKADIIKRILKDEENLPAGQVLPIDGDVTWIMDEEAGSTLE